jgi:hypothetical protein
VSRWLVVEVREDGEKDIVLFTNSLALRLKTLLTSTLRERRLPVARWLVVEVREDGEKDIVLFNNSSDVMEYLDNTEGYNFELTEIENDD